MKNLWKKIGVEECPKTKIMDINLQENMPEIPQIQKISRQQKDDLQNQLDAFSFSHINDEKNMTIRDICPSQISVLCGNNANNTFIFDSPEQTNYYQLHKNDSFSKDQIEDKHNKGKQYSLEKQKKLVETVKVLRRIIIDMRETLQQTKEEMKSEKKYFKKTCEKMLKKFQTLLKKKQGSRNSTEINSQDHNLIIKNLKEINDQLSKRVKEMDKKETQRALQFQVRLEKKQLQKEKCMNELYKIKTKNQSLLLEIQKLKSQNSRLSQRIFDYQQKMKGFDLEVEKKFTNFVQDYKTNFLEKNLSIKEKIRTFATQLNQQPFKNTKQRLTTESTEVKKRKQILSYRQKFTQIESTQTTAETKQKYAQSLNADFLNSQPQKKISSILSQETLKNGKIFVNMKNSSKLMNSVNSAFNNSMETNRSSICIDERLQRIKKDIKKELKEMKKM